jgi:hypothetical protein
LPAPAFPPRQARAGYVFVTSVHIDLADLSAEKCQRITIVAQNCALDLAQHQQMIAAFMAGNPPTLEPREAAIDQGDAMGVGVVAVL